MSQYEKKIIKEQKKNIVKFKFFYDNVDMNLLVFNNYKYNSCQYCIYIVHKLVKLTFDM